MIAVRPFDASRHRIGRSNDGRVLTIDRRAPYGTDEATPHEEVGDLRVRWANGEWKACPERLLSDCFNLLLENEPQRVDLRVFDEAKAMQLRVQGSDAAGSYLVAWCYSWRTGKWKRYIRNESM